MPASGLANGVSTAGHASLGARLAFWQAAREREAFIEPDQGTSTTTDTAATVKAAAAVTSTRNMRSFPMPMTHDATTFFAGRAQFVPEVGALAHIEGAPARVWESTPGRRSLSADPGLGGKSARGFGM